MIGILIGLIAMKSLSSIEESELHKPAPIPIKRRVLIVHRGI